jgi:CDP-diacylglycerol--glycerol-3-phosphate 3-phosphatidyltransferase
MGRRPGYLLLQIVTCARVPAALIAIPFVLEGGSFNYAIAFALYLASEISDILDGNLARALKLESQFGKLFDPFCDSIYRLCVFFTLATAGIFPLWVVWVMAVRDVTVAYGRMAAILRGHVVAARISGKLKAVIQGGAACTALGIRFVPGFGPAIGWMTTTMAIIVVAVTAWSMLDYASGALRILRQDAGPEEG